MRDDRPGDGSRDPGDGSKGGFIGGGEGDAFLAGGVQVADTGMDGEERHPAGGFTEGCSSGERFIVVRIGGGRQAGAAGVVAPEAFGGMPRTWRSSRTL
ncbi:MAG: hypothetical protein M5U12_20035 [Verrucomicrobia bacterium]|nr:hypothetical protein [Verrucomicrobiota bacterium]